jgi:gliding motility-associated-like protein
LGSPTLSTSKGLKGISSTRYWELDLVSGGLGGSRITLPVRGEGQLLTDIERAVVAESSALNENFKSIGQFAISGNASNGTVTSNDPITGPYLAVGAISDKPNIVVFNAVSPNGDGLNEFLRLGNLEFFDNVTVTIFNRWGDKVFEISKYNNDDRVFRGFSNVNGDKELVAGTYFYLIDKGDGSEKENGYISIKK